MVSILEVLVLIARSIIDRRISLYMVAMLVCVVISYAFDVSMRYLNKTEQDRIASRIIRINTPRVHDNIYIYNPYLERPGYVEVIDAVVLATKNSPCDTYVIQEQNTEERYILEMKREALVNFKHLHIFVLNEKHIRPRIGDLISTHTSLVDIVNGEDAPTKSSTAHVWRVSKVIDYKSIVLENGNSEYIIPLHRIHFSRHKGFTIQ